MGRLGFKNVHTKAGNFFEVYQIPVNEIQPTLAYVDEREAGASSLPAMTEGDLPFWVGAVKVVKVGNATFLYIGNYLPPD